MKKLNEEEAIEQIFAPVEEDPGEFDHIYEVLAGIRCNLGRIAECLERLMVIVEEERDDSKTM